MRIVTNPQQIDKKKWRKFVEQHPHGNIFQMPEMYKVYANTHNYKPIIIAALGDNDEMEGVLLAVIQQEHSGWLGRFTARSIIFGGPIIANDSVLTLEAILVGYVRIAKSKVIYTQFRNFKTWDETLLKVFANYRFVWSDHLNILVDTGIDEIELWKNVKRNRKDGINKAQKQGFTFSNSPSLENINVFFDLFKQLYDKVNLPYPDISFFKNISLHSADNVKWFTLSFQDEPVIILCAFDFNSTLFIFSIGISQDDELLKLRPVDLFYWEVLLWCSKNGIKTFDWMGAGKPAEEYGVRKFKLQYGGQTYNFGRFEKIHKPLLYSIGKLGLKLWQKLK